MRSRLAGRWRYSRPAADRSAASISSTNSRRARASTMPSSPTSAGTRSAARRPAQRGPARFLPPPSATGAGKIFAAARANGWQPKLTPAPPTYAIAADPAAAARDKMHEVVRDFLRAVDNPVPWQGVSNMPPPPIAHAACIDVGVGKTKITIEELAPWLKQKARDPVVYATPRHNLNEDVLSQFTDHGINARIFRGREAEDPQRDLLRPDKKMCLNLAALELAKKCHAEIGPTCCKHKHKKLRCPFFDQCGYQRQLRDR